MTCHYLVVATSLLVLLGCSRPEPKPELILSPTVKSLEKYVGSYVAIEGKPWNGKEGESIDANGVNIIVGTPVGVPYEWPSDSRTIRVAGTLKKNAFPADIREYPYVIKSATWMDAAKVSK